MEVFSEYLSQIENPQHRSILEEVLGWVHTQFPELGMKIAWKQPMFTDHGTFILGFSVSKNHIAISPEGAGMVQFREKIEQAGYEQSKMLFRIKWEQPVNYGLLQEIIAFNRADKAGCTTFWRK